MSRDTSPTGIGVSGDVETAIRARVAAGTDSDRRATGSATTRRRVRRRGAGAPPWTPGASDPPGYRWEVPPDRLDLCCTTSTTSPTASQIPPTACAVGDAATITATTTASPSNGTTT